MLNQIAGGWTVSGIARIQTGRPFLLTSGRLTVNQRDAGVILNGITVEELQEMVEVRPDRMATSCLPRIVDRQRRARESAILSAPTTPGEFGEFVYLYGPGLWNVDIGFAKQFEVASSKHLNFELLFIDAFNHRNTTVGGTGGATHSITSTRSGRPRAPRSGQKHSAAAAVQLVERRSGVACAGTQARVAPRQVRASPSTMLTMTRLSINRSVVKCSIVLLHR